MMLARFVLVVCLCVCVCGSVLGATEASNGKASIMLTEGNRLLDVGRFDEAMALFERVRRDYPGDEEAALAQINCARTLISWSRFEEAERMLRGVVESNPGKLVACWAQYWLGKSLVIQGKNEETIREMLKVQAMLPDRTDIEPFTRSRYTVGRLANLYAAEHKDLSDVVAHLGLDPTSPEARAQTLAILAGYPGKNGRIDLANPPLERLIKGYPDAREDIHWASTEVAVGYLRGADSCRGDYTDMAAEMLVPVYESGDAHDDQAAIASVWLAKYYDNNDKPEEALAVLRKAAGKYVNTAHADELLYDLGSLLCKQGRNTEARAAFNKLITEMPQSKRVATAQYVLEQLKKYDGAEKPAFSGSMSDLIKRCIAEYDKKQRDLAFSPSDVAVDDPQVVATQAVALAHADLPEQAFELLDRFAAGHKNAEADIERVLSAARTVCEKYPDTTLASWARYFMGAVTADAGDVVQGINELRKVCWYHRDQTDYSPFDAARAYMAKLLAPRITESVDVADLADYLGTTAGNARVRAEMYAIIATHWGEQGRVDLGTAALNKLRADCGSEADEIVWTKVELASACLRSRSCGAESRAWAEQMLESVLSDASAQNDVAAKATLWLAKSYEATGKHLEAMELLRAAESRFRNTAHSAELLHDLGVALYRQGHIDEATSIFKKVVSRYPSTRWARMTSSYLDDRSNKTLPAEFMLWMPPSSLDGSGNAGAVDDVVSAIAAAQQQGSPAKIGLLQPMTEPYCESYCDLLKAKMEVAMYALRSSAASKSYSRPTGEMAYLVMSQIAAMPDVYSASLRDEFISSVESISEDADIAALSVDDRVSWLCWLGEIYKCIADYRHTAEMYSKVGLIAKAPVSVRAKALYHAGLAYREFDYKDSARRNLQAILENYSETSWADLARAELTKWEKADNSQGAVKASQQQSIHHEKGGE